MNRAIAADDCFAAVRLVDLRIGSATRTVQDGEPIDEVLACAEAPQVHGE